jgi:hypothetical protein
MRFLHAMLHRLLAPVLATLAVLGAAAPAAARPPARAVLVSCERASAQAARAGVFEGRMRALPGTSRMQMRFTLQARTPDRPRWSAVTVPGFGTWATAAAGTARYSYTKRVEGLLAPAAYRVQVRFRWLDARGRVLAAARASSPPCRQPDPRANLVVRSIGIGPAADPSRRRYLVLVRNTGRAAAEPSSLAVSVAGRPLPAASVAGLHPREATLVTVEGPACAGGDLIEAEADAEEAVDESDEDDNRFSRLCPWLPR